jgi:hypothetical protein
MSARGRKWTAEQRKRASEAARARYWSTPFWIRDAWAERARESYFRHHPGRREIFEEFKRQRESGELVPPACPECHYGMRPRFDWAARSMVIRAWRCWPCIFEQPAL